MATVLDLPVSIHEEVAMIREASAARNPWGVLGIAPESSYRQIKSAQRKWIRKLHPDKWHTTRDGDLRDDVEEAFYEVQAAYLEALKRLATSLGTVVVDPAGPIPPPPQPPPHSPLHPKRLFQRLRALFRRAM